MGKNKNKKQENESESDTAVNFTEEMALHFRDRIRAARSATNADAEASMEAVYVIEDLGRVLTPGKSRTGMAAYEEPIRKMFFGDDEASKEFLAVWHVVKRERNSAVHEGAAARHLAANLIELLTQIEDAIMTKTDHGKAPRLLKHLMVRNPVCAEPWMTLEMVRKAMLANSFSTIPVFMEDGWRLITDESLARVADKKKFASTIAAATEEKTISPAKARGKGPEVPVVNLLEEKCEGPAFPVLVLHDGKDEKDKLLGILSAYDLL